MSRYELPSDLAPGDVISPPFNPDMAIVFECWHPARLAEALPGAWAPELSPDHPVWVVCGNRWRGTGRPEGEPVQITARAGDGVRLHLRDGKRVGDP